MKSAAVIMLALLLAGCPMLQSVTIGGPAAPAPSSFGAVQPNAYGPGIHSDQFGRPVRLGPSSGGSPGYYGDSQLNTPNAYGPGVHSDQYGRPVQVYPTQ